WSRKGAMGRLEFPTAGPGQRMPLTLAQTSVWETALQPTSEASKLVPKNPLLQALWISIFLALMTMTRASCVVVIQMVGWERVTSHFTQGNTFLSAIALNFVIQLPARTA